MNKKHFSLRAGDILNRFDDVEQFTGLHDQNGVEIYEGDIVKSSGETKIRALDSAEVNSPWWEMFTIGYKAPSFNCTIVAQGNSFFGELPATKSINTFALDISTVIGNIHENPELLEETP